MACERQRFCRGPRQPLEKGLEACRIEAEHRRKLPQERPELVAQVEDPRGEKIRQRSFEVLQAQEVRNVARALDAVEEAGRRLAVPLVVVLRSLQRVERAVDLDGGKVPAAELELAALGKAFGIPDAAPGCVTPSRDADSHHGRNATRISVSSSSPA